MFSSMKSQKTTKFQLKVMLKIILEALPSTKITFRTNRICLKAWNQKAGTKPPTNKENSMCLPTYALLITLTKAFDCMRCQNL